jgi:ABC-type sugar transport system ATPase subunit
MTDDSATPAGMPNEAHGARSADADRAPASLATADPPAVPNGNGSLLELRGISKHFGAVQALTDVDLEIPAGKVTALIGDNGAGKSTVIKTVSGIWQPDGGQIVWLGEPVHISSPRAASELGIATVYQDLALCDNLDIVQNVYLGREIARLSVLDETQMELKAKDTLAGLSVTSVRSIRQPVGSLSGGQRQAVAVARAVMFAARLVILDEPTAALGVAQTAMVLDLIKRLAANGIAVIVISHNLNDIFEVADAIAVLYLGRMVAAGPASEFDRQRVVELMTTGAFSGDSLPNGAAREAVASHAGPREG